MKKRILVDFVLTWKKIAAALCAVVVLALGVSFSGMISISASSGHFAPVGWFLHWTMRNAVDRQSIGTSVPEDVDLTDPALVQRAAGHFATGCAPCHGAPGIDQSPVVLSMTPPPPRLENKVGEWKDRELHWIALNGIKYSGMPAWPAIERKDEVWSMVAFLRALPSMDARTYADLALGEEHAELDPEAGGGQTAGLDGVARDALADCARCHGRDGLGTGAGERSGAFPVIAGQPEAYLAATLLGYRSGERHSGYMQPPATRYDPEVLRALAAWYADQAAPANLSASVPNADGIAEAAEPQEPDGIPAQIFPDANRSRTAHDVAFAPDGADTDDRSERLRLGRAIAEHGIPSRKIPACDSCHASGGRERNEHYPYLGGQPAWYVKTHLEMWKEHGTERGGTRYSHLMTPIARHLSAEQIEAVALWYARGAPGE